METIIAQFPVARPSSLHHSSFKYDSMVPVVSPSYPNVIQAISYKYPSTRLSSGPASSPQVIGPFFARRDSIRLDMSDIVSQELVLGTDVTPDNSSDQDWEDNVRSMMQTFTVDQTDWIQQRKSRKRNSMALLSRPVKASIHSISGIDDDQTNVEYVSGSFENEERGPKRARRISLLRLNKDTVRLVQHSPGIDSPGYSIKSNYFDCVSSNGNKEKSCLCLTSRDEENSRALLSLSPTSQNYHRRTASESMMADSTINAHMATMHALESRNLDLPPVAPHGFTYLQSATTSESPQSSSCPSSRTTLSSLLSANSDRLVYIPSRFSETQYPLTTKKEHRKFKPHTQRSCSYPSVNNRGMEESAKLNDINANVNREDQTTFGDCKGNRMLGFVASEEKLLQRSGHERKIKSQGLKGSDFQSGSASAESMIWLSLRKHGWMKDSDDGKRRKMVRFDVPNVSSLHDCSYPEKTRMRIGEVLAFDDKRFAEDLQAGHRKLAGSCFLRTFSAHRLCAVRLSQTNVWSGTQTQTTTEGLLAAGDGICISEDTQHPLTEEGLIKLLRKPHIGQERFMWVHWARRIAASNSVVQTYPYMRDSSRLPPPTITTIEFLHTPCTFRILMALAICLLGCITAVLIWIFMSSGKIGMEGDAEEQTSKHVGDGVGIGILVLMLEGVGVWTWIAFS